MLGMSFLSIWWEYSGTVLVNTDLRKHLSDNWDISRCSTTPGSQQHLSSVTSSSSDVVLCYSGQGARITVSFSKQHGLLWHFVLHTFKLITIFFYRLPEILCAGSQQLPVQTPNNGPSRTPCHSHRCCSGLVTVVVSPRSSHFAIRLSCTHSG